MITFRIDKTYNIYKLKSTEIREISFRPIDLRREGPANAGFPYAIEVALDRCLGSVEVGVRVEPRDRGARSA
jgi:hypothetical protein